MKPIEVIEAKRLHLARLANQRGAAGEVSALADMDNWVARPAGMGLRVLLDALRDSGINIKGSSFDAIDLPTMVAVDFTDPRAVRIALASMTFIEIKSASQPRVKPGFAGYFFALTESEIHAAEALGPRHRVALYNKLSGELLLTSIPEILARAMSSTWQLSVQL